MENGEWSKEKVDVEKVPVFIIATNKQLTDIVKQTANASNKRSIT